MSAQNPERRVKAPVATPNPRGTGEGRGHARGRGLALAPPLRAAYLSGRGLWAAQLLVGGRGAWARPPRIRAVRHCS